MSRTPSAWREREEPTKRRAGRSDVEERSRTATRANDRLDPYFISRWEDDGGYIPTVPRSAPC